MKRFVAMMMVALLAMPALALARDAFDGTWNVVISPDEDAHKAGEKEFKDVLTFKGMQFESSECKKHGFASTQYEEDTRAGIIATFKAKVKSSKGKGTAEWTGQAQAATISGELTWTKKDGTVMKYTYKGEKKQ